MAAGEGKKDSPKRPKPPPERKTAGDAKPGAKRMRYSQAQIIAAIRASGGMITTAARKLNVRRSLVYSWMERHPAIAEAVKDERERLVDMAEIALFQQIRDGNTAAVIFALKCLGKARGYVERQEIAGPDGGPVKVVRLPCKAASAEDWETQVLGPRNGHE